VKITLSPAQIGFTDAAIVTLAGKIGFTDIVIVFEAAGLPDKQGVAFEVKTQEIVFPFANAELVYVAEFTPAFNPFSFHW
jgi:hypothetical protein